MNKIYRQPSFREIENKREELSEINYYRQLSFSEIEEKRIELEIKDDYRSSIIKANLVCASRTSKMPPIKNGEGDKRSI